MDTTQERLLQIAAKLFAQKGFSGVSMRAIANTAGITQAAIYHHFANKEELYFAAVRYLNEDKSAAFIRGLSVSAPPEARLASLVEQMLSLLGADPDFCRIYFRELLEGDHNRLSNLVTNVFGDVSPIIEQLLTELAPDQDSHLLALSLGGLVFHHLEARKLSQFMPGGKPEHTDLTVLANHITALLLHGVKKR
jgi:AcrR family transcriptional regulator